jgi:hypothetical protein
MSWSGRGTASCRLAAELFRGRVTAVREVTWSSSTDGTQFRSKEVTFRVTERFKGPQAPTYRLFTGDCSNGRPEISDCGVFDVAKRSVWAVDFLKELRGPGAVER